MKIKNIFLVALLLTLVAQVGLAKVPDKYFKKKNESSIANGNSNNNGNGNGNGISFANPYGIAVDEKTGFMYVSNVNGELTAKDGNGYISRLKSDGTVDEIKFINGGNSKDALNAPTGMVVLNTTLYVCDIDALRAYNLLNKKFMFNVNFGDLPVQHFYDITIGPDGALYVTDADANRVYRIDVSKQHEVTTFIANLDLGGPRGIVWYPLSQSFIVAGAVSGKITAYDKNGATKQLPSIFLKAPQGLGLDDSGNIYVADMSLENVYLIPSNFALLGFKQGLQEPTGIAYNRMSKKIAISSFKGNEVVFVEPAQ
ncbi:MAG: hypothetical protein ABH859_04685 [Pseudomonadota bacterium]